MRLSKGRSVVFAAFLFAGAMSCGGEGDEDEPFCGDGVCSGLETSSSCSSDCEMGGPRCGDGMCNGNETASLCSADCAVGASCGDNSCNGNETCSSCAGDCGACCTTSPDNCNGENACIGGQCISAFGRNYAIRVVSGTMTTTDEAGDPWDALGGLPDPMVVITLNGSVILTTNAVQDTVSPSWNRSATAVIAAGSSFRIEVLDEDVASNDLMFGCGGQLTGELLRFGQVQCDGDGVLSMANVQFAFERQ